MEVPARERVVELTQAIVVGDEPFSLAFLIILVPEWKISRGLAICLPTKELMSLTVVVGVVSEVSFEEGGKVLAFLPGDLRAFH
jgi:hypothetical protein